MGSGVDALVSSLAIADCQFPIGVAAAGSQSIENWQSKIGNVIGVHFSRAGITASGNGKEFGREFSRRQKDL